MKIEAQSGCDLSHFDVAVIFGLLKEGGGALYPPFPLGPPTL